MDAISKRVRDISSSLNKFYGIILDWDHGSRPEGSWSET